MNSSGNIIVERIKPSGDTWVKDVYNISGIAADQLLDTAGGGLLLVFNASQTASNAALAEGQRALPAEGVGSTPAPLRSWWVPRCVEVADRFDFDELEVRIAALRGYEKFDVGINRFRRVCEGIENFDFPSHNGEVVNIKHFVQGHTEPAEAFVASLGVSQLTVANMPDWIDLMDDVGIDIQKLASSSAV